MLTCSRLFITCGIFVSLCIYAARFMRQCSGQQSSQGESATLGKCDLHGHCTSEPPFVSTISTVSISYFHFRHSSFYPRPLSPYTWPSTGPEGERLLSTCPEGERPSPPYTCTSAFHNLAFLAIAGFARNAQAAKLNTAKRDNGVLSMQLFCR